MFCTKHLATTLPAKYRPCSLLARQCYARMLCEVRQAVRAAAGWGRPVQQKAPQNIIDDRHQRIDLAWSVRASLGHAISRCKIGRLNERRAAWSPGCRGCANGGAL